MRPSQAVTVGVVFGEPIMINTEQRTHDWIAFLDGNRDVWESGRDEVEAVGKLTLRLQKTPPLPTGKTGNVKMITICPMCFEKLMPMMIHDDSFICDNCGCIGEDLAAEDIAELQAVIDAHMVESNHDHP